MKTKLILVPVTLIVFRDIEQTNFAEALLV